MRVVLAMDSLTLQQMREGVRMLNGLKYRAHPSPVANSELCHWAPRVALNGPDHFALYSPPIPPDVAAEVMRRLAEMENPDAVGTEHVPS